MRVLVPGDEGLAAIPPGLLWRDRAACRDVEEASIFFPSPGRSGDAAKAVCSSCPVTTECLAFALEHCCQGIWGGTTDVERARLGPRRRPGPRPGAPH